MAITKMTKIMFSYMYWTYSPEDVISTGIWNLKVFFFKKLSSEKINIQFLKPIFLSVLAPQSLCITLAFGVGKQINTRPASDIVH